MKSSHVLLFNCERINPVISLPSTSKPASFRSLVFLPSSAYLCCLRMVDIISKAHTLMVSHPFTIRPDFIALFEL
jgi:hypothetical protein